MTVKKKKYLFIVLSIILSPPLYPSPYLVFLSFLNQYYTVYRPIIYANKFSLTKFFFC